MPEQFLDLAAIADLAGITIGSARQYHKRATANRDAGDVRTGDLPAPDITLGKTPGWRRRTIDRWIAGREGRAAARIPDLDPFVADVARELGIDPADIIPSTVLHDVVTGGERPYAEPIRWCGFCARGHYPHGIRVAMSDGSAVTRYSVQRVGDGPIEHVEAQR